MLTWTFAALKEKAEARGQTLERGRREGPYGIRSGYILTIRELWKRYDTLDNVAAAIRAGKHI